PAPIAPRAASASAAVRTPRPTVVASEIWAAVWVWSPDAAVPAVVPRLTPMVRVSASHVAGAEAETSSACIPAPEAAISSTEEKRARPSGVIEQYSESLRPALSPPLRITPLGSATPLYSALSVTLKGIQTPYRKRSIGSSSADDAVDWRPLRDGE